jgi:hypothetical protein
MTTTPTGSPLWARTAEIGHYGGNVNKSNYLSRGAIDALTDVDAEQFARLTADVTAFALTAPFCTLSFGCRDSATPGAPIIGGYRESGAVQPMGGVHMCTGIRLVPYVGDEAPAGFPSATRVSDGVVDITFAASYLDGYGVEGAFSVTHVKPGCAVANAVQRVVAEVTGPQTIRVRVFDASDAAVPDARVSGLRVW